MSKRKISDISDFFTKKPRTETNGNEKISEDVDPNSSTTEIEQILIEPVQLSTPTSTPKGQRKSGVDQKWKTDFPWIRESSDGNSFVEPLLKLISHAVIQ